jgi:hypothetical protein
MELKGMQAVIIIPADEWKLLKNTIQEIQLQLKNAQVEKPVKNIVSPYITAKEFMAAVRICRSNFDKLVNRGRIMTLKKGRKVYVVASEVDRYFREVEL